MPWRRRGCDSASSCRLRATSFQLPVSSCQFGVDSGESRAVGVGGDGRVDIEGQGEGGAALRAGYAGGGAGPDRGEEVFEFQAEGFGFFYGEFLEVEARGWVGCRHSRGGGPGQGFECGPSHGRCCRGGGADFDGEEFLAGEVEGEVLAGLEEAELADLLGGDAGSGEVGDAAGVELDADVGDVDLAGEDGEADRTDLADRGVGELEDDVEVVDHEVEDDIDVERARGEDAEAVGLEEHGAVEQRLDRGDGGVETFEVADLDDPLVNVGK